MAVFVGRDDELRVLGGGAAAPLAGDVAAAVAPGDPGSGKCRLLAEARYGVRVPHAFEILGYEPEPPPESGQAPSSGTASRQQARMTPTIGVNVVAAPDKSAAQCANRRARRRAGG